MADKHGTISESKELCDKVRNYESHIEETSKGYEQGAGDDSAGSEAAAGGARGRPVAVRGGRRRGAGYGGAQREPGRRVPGERPDGAWEKKESKTTGGVRVAGRQDLPDY